MTAMKSGKKGDTKMDDELEKILETRKADIKVIGAGGSGCNTISRMNEIGIVGAETIAINTDAQDLLYTDCENKILIGKDITKGLGTGADPKLGEEAAKENKKDLQKIIGKADMIFVTCGLGGGTGTGALPVVSETAKKAGSLTVGVVTLPFSMEGKQRETNARIGLEKLTEIVDTLIVIPNDKLLEIVPDVSLSTAFKVADEILVNAVKGIAELVTKPGLVNLDFADVRTVMSNGGLAMIGLAESDTERRAAEAVEKALNTPLIDIEIEGATGALINVSGGADMTIKEAQEIVQRVNERLDPDAKVIWGAQVDPSLGDTIRAMIIVTGVKSPQIYGATKTYTEERKKEIEKVLGIDFVD